MNVDKIGAGASRSAQGAENAKASRGDRGAKELSAEAAADVVRTSSTASLVRGYVARAAAAPEVRADVVEGYRNLMGRGLLDTPEAATKAAFGILAAR
jgi:hypothetical protein